MTGSPSGPRPRSLIAGGVATLFGLVSWVLYAVAAGAENTSYDPHGSPPAYVHVSRGHTYWIAVPGGVARLRAGALAPSTIKCTAEARGGVPADLPVSPVVQHDTDDSKFVNRIASFEAARSADLHVECSGLGGVYVENADDAGFDWSGLLLVLASAALAVGLPLVLSGLRRPRGSVTAAGKHHQVQ